MDEETEGILEGGSKGVPEGYFTLPHHEEP